VAVKDEFDQLPYATTQGTCFLKETLTGQDATIVARLRTAGALLIGKTNMHEFGAGVTGHNPHHGTVRNPYHPSHHTGGSSSGSAAAVAAGLCPVALGTDGGGSIRIPAAFCGVVGLKPTYGRISNFGATSQGCSVSQSGPITATARDAALTYALLAGPDPKDWVSLRQPMPTLEGFVERKLTDITLGIYRPWFEHASSAMVTICYELLERLVKRGVKLRDIAIPDLDAGRIGHIVTIISEMASALDPYYTGQRQHFSLEARLNLVLGRSLYSRDYVQAQRWRTRMTHHFYQALQEVDMIVTPTTGCTAPLIEPDALEQGMSDLSLLTEIMRFVVPANFIGFPAITFPAGYDNEGLPVGLHAIGRPWQEHLLLRLAYVAEDFVERRISLLHYRLLPEC
jgi:Asp-tRNA(Asn)/Glu-tRNA(Gln) amidotransferase A subunit family amidase